MWQYTSYTLPMAVSALISFFVVVYTWLRRSHPGAWPLCTLALGVSLWSLGACLEMAAVSFEHTVLWLKLKYLGVVIAPASLLLFALGFSGRSITLRDRGWLVIEPLLVLMLVWNDALHPYFWATFTKGSVDGVVYYATSAAAGFWIHALYSYGLTVVAFGIMLQTYRKSYGPYRKQVGAIIGALLIPWLSNAYYLSPLNITPYLDITPISFAMTGILASWSLLRFRLFDLAPVARDILIDYMDYGVLVLNEDARIVDVNPAGMRLLGISKEAVGQEVSRVTSQIANWTSEQSDDVSRSEMMLSQTRSVCEVVYFQLRDNQGAARGQMVMLQDIGERVKREEEDSIDVQARERIGRMEHSRDFGDIVCYIHEVLGNVSESLVRCEFYVFERENDATRCLVYRVDGKDTRAEGPTIRESMEQAFTLFHKEGQVRYRPDVRSEDIVSQDWLSDDVRSCLEIPLSSGVFVASGSEENAFSEVFIERARRLGNLLNEALRRQSDLRVNERYLHQLEEEVAQRRLMMEELNKAKEQAESALQVKGLFLANMSHELRTPMSAVLGITELLLDEDLDVEHRQQLQTVYDSADHLLRLLNELLDLSRIEQGSIELNAEPFSLRSCVEDAMRIARPLAQGKSLRVESHVEEAVAPAYVGDSARLYQVLVNLMGNAIKFTSEGGVRVEVTTAPSEVNGDAVRIVVIDTGIGIPPDKKAAIFDAFTQVDSSITREFGGTGLGLAICQEIVQMMGSSIEVDSEVGSGSTFYFTLHLPRATESVKEKPVEAPHREQPENVCRVLLAEDVLINQKIVQSMLGKRGHEVVTVDTGSAALELLQSDRNFNMVLMDMHMPSMGGVEATVKLREYEREHQLKPLKISALTANAMEEDRQMCVEAGMNFYLTKPFSADELLALVEQGN